MPAPKPETGVPIPSAKGGSVGKYRFADMAAGESRFYPGEKNEGPVAWAARNHAKRSGERMVTRVVNGGLRVWKVE